MRWGILFSLLYCIVVPRTFAGADATVLKVLPHLLDHKGRHTLSPSLYERDAYQARLRKHPEERGGLRFDVQWRLKSRPTGTLKLKIETRSAVAGQTPQDHVLEQTLAWKNHWSHWGSVGLTGPGYDGFGELTAWRVTLWDGDKQAGEAKSFLW